MAKKKGSKKKAEVGAAPKGENQITALEKEIFTNQVKELETRLERQLRLCQTLEEENKVYQARYEKEVEDKEDIVDYLKRSLQDRSVEINELHERLHGLQNAHQVEKDNYEKRLKDLAAEYAETKEKLTAENMTLNGKLALVEEFRFQKDVVLAKLNDAEREAAEQAKQYESKLQTVESQKLKNLEMLKKEMVERVENMAAEFRKTSERQLSHTVKQAVNETARLNAQLSSLSELALNLTEMNRKLKETESDLKVQIKIKENSEHRMSVKIKGLEKLVTLLEEKCEKERTKVKAYDKLKDDYDTLQRATELEEHELTELKDEIKHLTKSKQKLQQRLEKMQEKLMKQSNVNAQLDSVIRSAENVIKYEVLGSLREGKKEESGRRDDILHQLLILLDTAANLEDKATTLRAVEKDFSNIQNRYEDLVVYEPGSLGFMNYSPKSVYQTKNVSVEANEEIQTDLLKDAQDEKMPGSILHNKDTAAKIMSDINLLNKLNFSEKHPFSYCQKMP